MTWPKPFSFSGLNADYEQQGRKRSNEGLDDYFVWSIQQDSKGNFWFGTANNGIFKYNGEKLTGFQHLEKEPKWGCVLCARQLKLIVDPRSKCSRLNQCDFDP